MKLHIGKLDDKWLVDIIPHDSRDCVEVYFDGTAQGKLDAIDFAARITSQHMEKESF